MKPANPYLIGVCILTALFVSGCIIIDLDGCASKKVKGSGNVVSETRQVPEFDKIHLKGTGKAFVTKGNIPSVEIKTDDNILPIINTEVRDGKLIVSHKDYNLKPTTLNYFFKVKNLNAVAVSGSADLIGDNKLVSDNFTADISGSGDMRLDLEVGYLESDISGSGSMHFSGKTDVLDASITGSGDMDALDLEAKKVSLKITGSGDCEVNASETLRVKITGSGDVKYKGSPQISQKVTGSGKVRSRN
jgi:hypothetical protein